MLAALIRIYEPLGDCI